MYHQGNDGTESITTADSDRAHAKSKVETNGSNEKNQAIWKKCRKFKIDFYTSKYLSYWEFLSGEHFVELYEEVFRILHFRVLDHLEFLRPRQEE